MPAVTFHVLEGIDKGRIFRDLTTPVTIGREEGNLMRLNDERVSRFHAKVQLDNDDFILTDLESTNGTRVNGSVVQIRRLRFGDRVCVGRSLLLFGSNEEIATRMASIGSQAENDFLHNTITPQVNANAWVGGTNLAAYGGTDNGAGSGGNGYVWTDGTTPPYPVPPGYANWAGGPPSIPGAREVTVRCQALASRQDGWTGSLIDAPFAPAMAFRRRTKQRRSIRGRFKTASHFATTFRSLTGVTPSAYRAGRAVDEPGVEISRCAISTAQRSA